MNYRERSNIKNMKAINKNIVCTDRNRLEEVIPLATPYTVAIDPSNLCNFKCSFCAIQSKKEELSFRKQLMDKQLFMKIIDDLKEFPSKLNVLRVNGQGEPLLNPDLPEMIKYAKEKDVAEFVEIITNGSRLSPEINQKLIDSGIDRIRISIEALDAEGYREMADVKINFDDFLRNIQDLHDKSGNCEIYCKIVDAAVSTEQDRQKFFDIFGDICDRIFIDHVVPMWSDFEEVNKMMETGKIGMHGQEVKNVQVCPFPFYSLIINSDGEVTVCCADWKRKLVVGDLKKESLKNVWGGVKLKAFWIAMLNGKKNDFDMCKKCLLPMYDCNDNIDDYAKQILERL